MKQRFYNEEDHRTELWPEHAHLPLYRATYSFEHNPKGHGQQATLILPTNDDFWVVAKFDEDLFDPDHPDRPTPAGIWCTYNREAFSNIEPLEGCKQFADIDSRALAVAQRLELQLDGRTFPGGRTQRVAMIQCAVADDLKLVVFSYGANSDDSYSDDRGVMTEIEAMLAIDRGKGKTMVIDNRPVFTEDPQT